MVNEFVLFQIHGEEKEYLSSNSYYIVDKDAGIIVEWLTIEIIFYEISNNKLVFKKRVPTILLIRNIVQWKQG